MAAPEQPDSARLWPMRPQDGIALVVVLAVVAGMLVLLARSESAVGPSASVGAGGLQMRIAVAPGPYFLSELLAVRLSLANDSPTAYQVQGFPRPSYCGDSALWVASSGGVPPTYQWRALLILQSVDCVILPSTLAPGEQWSFVQFIPLASSGRVTLSAQATFMTVVSTEPDGGTSSTGGVGPFTQGWPSVTIQVEPQVPANRTIELTAAHGRLTISPPPGAGAHLYYLYSVVCSEGGGTGFFHTNGYLQPISSTVLAEPDCPGSPERWEYSVAAPGYGIASGMLGDS